MKKSVFRQRYAKSEDDEIKVFNEPVEEVVEEPTEEIVEEVVEEKPEKKEKKRNGRKFTI